MLKRQRAQTWALVLYLAGYLTARGVAAGAWGGGPPSTGPFPQLKSAYDLDREAEAFEQVRLRLR